MSKRATWLIAVVVVVGALAFWDNPARGLAEIYRVLRPGGVALIYDIADWIARLESRGPGIATLLRESPFAQGGTWDRNVTTHLGPIPLVYRVRLRRDDLGR